LIEMIWELCHYAAINFQKIGLKQAKT